MNNCFYNLFNLALNRLTYCYYIEDNDDYRIINDKEIKNNKIMNNEIMDNEIMDNEIMDNEIKKSVIIYYVCPDCGYKFSNIKCVCGYIYKPK